MILKLGTTVKLVEKLTGEKRVNKQKGKIIFNGEGFFTLQCKNYKETFLYCEFTTESRSVMEYKDKGKWVRYLYGIE